MRKQNVKDIDLIVIHCSASRESKPYTFDQLVRDHKDRGFETCGYHIFISRSGMIYSGRTFDTVGAHAAPHNTNSIGICYEGGLNRLGKARDTRTDAQKEQLLNSIFDVLREVKSAGGDTKRIKIVGHRDLSPDKNGDGQITPEEWVKECPCFDASEEYKDITKLF